MKLLGIVFFLFSVQAMAVSQKLSFSQSDVSIQKNNERSEFTDVTVKGFDRLHTLGAPSLPVKTFLVVGSPADVKVTVEIIQSTRASGVKPSPAQREPCRCVDDQKRSFEYNEGAYNQRAAAYTVSSLGAFRGTPISQVTVALAQYDSATNSTVFFNEVQVDSAAKAYSFRADQQYTDYLILAPEKLALAADAFAQWKTSQGYKVIVEKLLAPQLTLKGVGDIIANHYKNDGTDFVVIIGDEKAVPMHSTPTSSGNATTDLYYFTMDGAKDYIPEMFYGRIPLNTADEIANHLDKTMAYDQKAYVNKGGLTSVIGIASNEGSNLSDNEYITGIEKSFVDTFGYTKTHFYQNDKKSNPTELNKALSSGAAWLFYMGHGSGYSWPSLYSEYEVSDVKGIANRDSVKPIVIDVACMNGRLLPGYLGTAFSSTLSTDAQGSAAYYGGTVNVSWHPPAIMAQGIAEEHAAKKFRHLGEAILAGQMYLAAKWSNSSDVVDNFEWYALQGDPGMVLGQ